MLLRPHLHSCPLTASSHGPVGRAGHVLPLPLRDDKPGLREGKAAALRSTAEVDLNAGLSGGQAHALFTVSHQRLALDAMVRTIPDCFFIF